MRGFYRSATIPSATAGTVNLSSQTMPLSTSTTILHLRFSLFLILRISALWISPIISISVFCISVLIIASYPPSNTWRISVAIFRSFSGKATSFDQIISSSSISITSMHISPISNASARIILAFIHFPGVPHSRPICTIS